MQKSDHLRHQDSDQGQRQDLFNIQSRHDRLKQIDALYKSQMNQIYLQSKQASQREIEKERTKKTQERTYKSRVNEFRNPNTNAQKTYYYHASQLTPNTQKTEVKRSVQSRYQATPELDKNTLQADSGKKSGIQQKIRASVFLQSESSRTIQILRRQNQTKEMKIRQLTSTCQNLLDKLRNHLPPQQAQAVIDSLKQFSQRKMERLESLFKIKNQEIFFKIKLQIISLLQQFRVSKDDINGINQISTQSALFSFMVRKLKTKLKDFKSKQQESSFEIQKDKILNQKYEQRVHYLMETNQLLKLSESKLKQKTEELRNQLNVFLQKMKLKQKQVQERQGQIFRLKKEKEELTASNQRILSFQKNLSSEMTDERRIYQAKEKEMKALLSNYFLEKKKLESELQEKETFIEELHIKVKYFEQQNQKVNRQYVRWKERYEWLQREKETRQREYEQEKLQLVNQFEDYKQQNNQGLFLVCKAQTDDALRKLQQYQNSYQKVIMELDDERRRYQVREEQIKRRIQEMEHHWIEKIKGVQQLKEDELYDMAEQMAARESEIRQEFEKKEKLLVEEMQARMKTFLAQNDKDMTQRIVDLEAENDDIRRDNDNLKRIVEMKQSSTAFNRNSQTSSNHFNEYHRNR